MNDVTITGFGQSELDDYLAEAARLQNRCIMPDPEAHNGMYFRSDHFNFAKRGVPALFAKGISDSREHGREWARRQMEDYWANRYHRPDDEYDPATSDLSGLAEDAQLMFRVGLRLSQEDRFPNWKEGSEFKAIREQSSIR